MSYAKEFNAEKAKHFIEGMHFVLHCHHYNTLLHRAIINTPFLDGAGFFFEVARDDFYTSMSAIAKRKIITGREKLAAACREFYRYCGFGDIDVSDLSENGGTVYALHSHMAAGYMKKWGKQAKPIDDMGRGFVAASWGVIYDRKPSKCRVKQIKCIACGDERGEFLVEV